MKVWVAHLTDGYGLSNIELRKDYMDAIVAGQDMLARIFGKDQKLKTIHNYADNKNQYLVIADYDEEVFNEEVFNPGEAQVLVKEMEVK